MKIPAAITISRPSGGRSEYISIQIECENSQARFCELEIPLGSFAAALTGLGYVKCSAEVRGLEVVGKFRVTENRTIACPLDTYDKKELTEWLRSNAQEDGWILNTCLGSQNSVSRTEGGTMLRYHVTKFVDQKP